MSAEPTERELFPAGDWVFTNDGGKSYEEGKVYWPALLRLRLDKNKMLELAETLIRAGRNREWDDLDETLEFPFVGTIERFQEDEDD